MGTNTISDRCADFILNLRYEDLPDSVIHMAKNCLIDFFACTLGGACTPESKIIKDFINENKESRKATVIGDWTQNSLMNAALANAYNCHILELDDVHQGAVIHAAAPVISAALAVAEAGYCTGKQLIEAIVAGYEIILRVGESVMPSHYYFWHTTATCGSFGAAAAAGKILGLSHTELVNAIGNAGTQSAGLWEFLEDNAMSKYLHCGRAASSGILASILAQNGLTGATKIIEGEKGFVRATSNEENPEKKFVSMGEHYKILENSFKPYASCRHTHSTIDAVLNLRKKYGLSGSEVEKLNINTYEVAKMTAGNTKPFHDARAAKFSLPYCAAVALHHGDVSIEAFSDKMLMDQDLLRTADKIEIQVGDIYNKEFPKKWISKVEIKTVDGRYLESTVEVPKGEPGNPLTDVEVDNKFMNLARLAISELEADLLLKKCRAIEDIDDIAKLFDFGNRIY